MEINLTLPDGNVRAFEGPISAMDVVKSISNSLAKNAIVAKYNDAMIDLSTVLDKDGSFAVYTADSEEGMHTFWHSSAHIMAQAVKRLYPDTKFGIGPAIKDGFYYDFDSSHTFSQDDLAKIEAEMEKIVKEDYAFERKVLTREEALALFTEKGETYKVELIRDLPEDAVITTYQQGDFLDLCAGPHVPSTGKIKTFKLMNIAGAYWRGNEKNKMLQRLYATSFPKKQLLDDYLFRLEEAKKRDHKKIGKELELFMIAPEGPGFPFFLPKGMVLRNILEDYWRKIHVEAGYVEIKTPVILNEELWHRSGHWDHYKDNMYTTKIDDVDYGIKPMNCPGGMIVYKSKMHSYKDLPLRAGELGLVHRHEKSGQLNGLFRVRCFTQDDAHIFCLPTQIEDEIKGVMRLVDEVYSKFGFDYTIELSTRPEDSMGSDELWEMAEGALAKVLTDMGKEYELNEGDGAFYGPKIDFHIKDCLGRDWQCGTIQLDFQMPERFDLTYIGEDGEKHRPVMLHRVIFGSIERFIGIITEHFAGAFPAWLAPVQVKVLNITDNQAEYAEKVVADLQAAGFRAEIDLRNEKIGYKIREAQTQKVPYVLIVGDKEMADGKVAVRKRGQGDIGAVSYDEFAAMLAKEVAEKSL